MNKWRKIKLKRRKKNGGVSFIYLVVAKAPVGTIIHDRLITAITVLDGFGAYKIRPLRVQVYKCKNRVFS